MILWCQPTDIRIADCLSLNCIRLTQTLAPQANGFYCPGCFIKSYRRSSTPFSAILFLAYLADGKKSQPVYQVEVKAEWFIPQRY